MTYVATSTSVGWLVISRESHVKTMAASISPKKARRRGKHFVIHVGYGDEAERVFRRWKGLKHKLRCQTDGELLMKVMDLAESELGLGSASFDRASLR